MIEIANTYNIILVLLVGTLGVSAYIIRNLMYKVEAYEDTVTTQTQHLLNVDKAITAGQKHLQNLDEKGVFQSDDEVGYFFEQMKTVQDEISRFKLPEDYAEKEIKS